MSASKWIFSWRGMLVFFALACLAMGLFMFHVTEAAKLKIRLVMAIGPSLSTFLLLGVLTWDTKSREERWEIEERECQCGHFNREHKGICTRIVRQEQVHLEPVYTLIGIQRCACKGFILR